MQGTRVHSFESDSAVLRKRGEKGEPGKATGKSIASSQ